MIKQRCKIATHNVNFTFDDNERPLFIDNDANRPVSQIKHNWRDKVFTGPFINCGYNELSTLDAVINIEYTNLKNVRNTNYVYVEVHGEDKYYFVSKVTIKNERVASLTLRLDTVTTYLDTIKFTNDLLVKRRHFDRYVKKDGRWIVNNSEESGIWNVERDIPTQSVLPKGVVPINVINPLKNDFNYFWPVSLMAIHDYKAGITPDEFTSYLDDVNRLYIGIWPSGFSIGYENGLLPVRDLTSIDYINKNLSPYIVKVYGSPLPLWPRKYLKTHSDGRLFTHTFDSSTYIGNGNSEPGWFEFNINNATYKPYIFTTNGIRQPRTDFPHEITPYEYPYKGTFNVDTMPKTYDTISSSTKIVDPKVYTSQHVKHLLSSVNGQQTTLVNEYLFNQQVYELSIKLLVTTEGIIQTVNIVNNKYYDLHNQDNSKTFTVSYKDQFPNASKPYAEFMVTNSNQYKTAQANTRRNQTWGAIGGAVNAIAGGAAGFASGGPVGAAMGAIGGAFSGGSAIIQGKNRLNELTAQVQDIKNIGETTELDDISIIKDKGYLQTSNFGDSKLAISSYMPSELQMKRIDSYYKKYGYECENLEPVNDYTFFNKRVKYSYFETASFKTCVDKSSVPVEVVDDLERIFGEGIRLWNVKLDGSVNMSDYHSENWEIPIFNELTK